MFERYLTEYSNIETAMKCATQYNRPRGKSLTYIGATRHATRPTTTLTPSNHLRTLYIPQPRYTQPTGAQQARTNHAEPPRAGTDHHALRRTAAIRTVRRHHDISFSNTASNKLSLLGARHYCEKEVAQKVLDRAQSRW